MGAVGSNLKSLMQAMDVVELYPCLVRAQVLIDADTLASFDRPQSAKSSRQSGVVLRSLNRPRREAEKFLVFSGWSTTMIIATSKGCERRPTNPAVAITNVQNSINQNFKNRLRIAN